MEDLKNSSWWCAVLADGELKRFKTEAGPFGGRQGL
jgi:hypothetical protein